MNFTRKAAHTRKPPPLMGHWLGAFMALTLGLFTPVLCITHCQIERANEISQQRARFLCDYHGGEEGHPVPVPRALYELLPALMVGLAGALTLINRHITRPTPPLRYRQVPPPTPPPRPAATA